MILLLTAFPVVTGLIGAGLYALTEGLVGTANGIVTVCLQFVLLALFTTAYVAATRIARRRSGEAAQAGRG